MKKIVLTFGLISGAISAALMFATVPFIYRIGFDWGTGVGYTSMLIAFLLVFFGIRSYRETVGNGQISFGKAFTVGILITLVSSLCYVIAWEIIYFNILPDFPDQYGKYLVEKARAGGASQEQIAAQLEQVKSMKAILDNPLLNGLVTLIEPLPVGLIVTLFSALILRKRREQAPNDTEQLASTS